MAEDPEKTNDNAVNLQGIREVTMDDEEFMAELIDIFLDDSPTQIRVLRDAIEGREGGVAASAAHRLKGSSGNLGADSLAALCRRVEESGRENRVEEMPGLLRDIEREFSRVKECLSAVRQDSDHKGFRQYRKSCSDFTEHRRIPHPEAHRTVIGCSFPGCGLSELRTRSLRSKAPTELRLGRRRSGHAR